MLRWDIKLGKSGVVCALEQRRNIAQFPGADPHNGFNALLNGLNVPLVGCTEGVPFQH
jgi:hypothetical protein